MQTNPLRPTPPGAAAGSSTSGGAGDAGDSGNPPQPPTADEQDYASLRAAWAVATPGRAQYAEVVQELLTLTMVGEGSVFERGPHGPATHLGYFKPPMDAFLNLLRQKDRRSAKEWEYVNAAGVWADMALTAMSLAKTAEGTTEVLSARLALAEVAMRASREMLAIRAQYFRDVTEHGVEMARQMSYLVEQSSDAVFSETHRSLRDTLTTKIELEAAKALAKARLEISGQKKKKKRGGARAADDSDQSE